MCCPVSARKHRDRGRNFPKLNKQTAKKLQLKLQEYYEYSVNGQPRNDTFIEAAGDPLQDKDIDNIRFLLHNINGMNLRDGLDVAPEISVIGAYQGDIAGYTEINTNATHRVQDQIRNQMTSHLGTSQVLIASGKATEDGYLPGGVMLASVGHHNGRIRHRGTDKWGRFTWFTMLGSRDEGILVITAYRVCQRKGTKPTGRTAYQQQITEMIKDGITDLDPRNQILKDLTNLIHQKREEGYLPILMMDANEEWERTESNELRRFMHHAHLVDAMREKHPDVPLPTYRTGSRLDYIFLDQAIVPAIKSIGQLGMHEGLISDHVMLHMDLDSRELFRGRLHRPVDLQSREFTVAQADKKQAFVDKFKELCQHQNIKQRVIDLAQALEKHGPTLQLTTTYQQIDRDIRDGMLTSAKATTKRKFGYQRSPKLGTHGNALLVWKSIASAKRCRMRVPEKTYAMAAKHGISGETIDLIDYTNAQKEVRAARHDLWDTQKRDAEIRIEWLESNAKNIAKAAGNDDWKATMSKMIKTTQDRAMNRKLTSAIKGSRHGLNRIEVPTHEWFYSEKDQEIYHYDRGVFEAHSVKHSDNGYYYTHHHLKVLPDDATTAEVHICDEHIALLTIYPASDFWQEITNQKEIEELIMARNKRHLQQVTIEEGRSHHPVMREIMENHGDNATVQAMLHGTYTPPDNTPPEIRAWIRSVMKTPAEQALPKITGIITKAEFQAAFKITKEFTSSSPSGMHYTLWKSVAADNDLAEFMCIMVSLPFMYGFVNERWTNSVDVMLEKSEGERKIHLLRIIGLMEADFNTALKIFFAKKLMHNAETSGLHEEQWGGRRNRSSIDAALQKLLTFEYGRYMKSTIALFANDSAACFDRMYPALSNVIGAKFGLSESIMHTRSTVMTTMKRSLRTDLGTTTESYTNIAGEHQMEGEYQGKGDVANLWAMTSHTVLTTYSDLQPPMLLPDVADKTKMIAKRNVSFVDDNDSFAGSRHADPDTIKQVVHDLKEGAQKWTNVLDVVGQSMAFHKSAWQILAHEEHQGTMRICTEVPYTINLKDSSGASTQIKQNKSSTPNKGLGYYLAPDGNQVKEFEMREQKTRQVCRGVMGIHTTEHEAHVSLHGRLVPQLRYGLHLTSFNQKQCTKLDKIITNTFLQRMRINRKSPRPLVYGPSHLGGHEFPKCMSLQDQYSIPYVIRTLRWDAILAKDLIQTMNAAQLAAGFVNPILWATNLRIDYIGCGWIPHIQERLRAMHGRIWAEEIWTPKLQRIDDAAIMEAFAQIPKISLRKLILANECRIYLRVITIAELSNINGMTIDINRLQGLWQAQSSLEWPNQPQPSKAHWAAFRKCLRSTFCPNASPFQRQGQYDLAKTLGAWYESKRHIIYDAYVTDDGLVRRESNQLYLCWKKPIKGFHRMVEEISELPSKSHPVQATFTSTGLWTHRTLRLAEEPKLQTTIELCDDTIDYDQAHSLIVVSDGSSHLDQQRASYAYKISQGKDHNKSVMGTDLMASGVEQYAFRSEMEGMYQGMQHATAIASGDCNIEQYCDCESAIKRMNGNIDHPKQTMAPEADIVLAYHHALDQQSHTVNLRHVKGHQDNEAKYDDLDYPTQCNIDCDKLADDTIKTTSQPEPFTPHPGSKAMLQINGKWITRDFEKQIEYAQTTRPMEEYIEERLGLSEYIRKSIDWDTIGQVRKRMKAAKRVRGTKLMYGWLPVGRNTAKIRGGSDVCPCCGAGNETTEHMFVCPDERMQTTIGNCIRQAARICGEKEIPNRIVSAFFDIILAYTKRRDYEVKPSLHTSIKRAIHAQQQVGITLFCRGFIAREWGAAMKATKTKFPQWKIEILLTTVWDTIFEPLWTCRNNILHKQSNFRTVADDSELSRKLTWFSTHQNSVLAYHLRHFADITPDDLRQWSRPTKRARVLLLEAAQRRLIIQRKQQLKHQRVLSEFFQPTLTLE